MTVPRVRNVNPARLICRNELDGDGARLHGAFREPFKSQRCLVPADGFYEWQRSGKAKQPYCFEVNDGVLAFAGLWDRWRSPLGEVIASCTILTTTPNSLLSDIHDRMPVSRCFTFTLVPVEVRLDFPL